MATQIEIQDELKQLGVELTGNETYRDLQGMLKAKKEEIAAAEEAAKEQAEKDAAEAAAKSGKGHSKPSTEDEAEEVESVSKFVWVKSRAYVNDNQRIEPGLFELDAAALAKFPRLSTMSSDAVEIFEESIPPLKLAQIAKWCGVNPDKYRSKDSDLLATIVTEPIIVK